MAFYNTRQSLLRTKSIGDDPIVDAILEKKEPEYSTYVSADELRKSKTKKSYLESALLASNDLEAIASLLEMPLDILTMYRDIFYNVTGMDKLSKLELIEISEAEEKPMKIWALTNGLHFLRWRLGGTVSISPVEGLEELFTTCMYKAREAMFSGNTSESSKESAKWVKLSMDLARLVKVWSLDASGAKRDLEMALREIIPDFGGLEDLDEIKDSVPKMNMASKELDVSSNVVFEDLNSIS